MLVDLDGQRCALRFGLEHHVDLSHQMRGEPRPGQKGSPTTNGTLSIWPDCQINQTEPPPSEVVPEGATNLDSGARGLGIWHSFLRGTCSKFDDNNGGQRYL